MKATEIYKEEHKLRTLIEERAVIQGKIQVLRKKGVREVNYNNIVLRSVKDVFGISGSEIFSTSHLDEICKARFCFSYISRDIAKLSYGNIGRILSISHSAVIYQMKIVDKMMKEDELYRKKVEKCIELVKKDFSLN